MQNRLVNSLLHLLAIASVWFAAGIAQAQIPSTLNYQGYLTNAASQPVNAAVNITFRLYTAASGGSPVWTETQSGIGVTNGVFNAVLGNASALALPFNVPYFLSLQVNTDAEMAVRQPLSAVPYALKASSADAVAAGATIPAAQITGTIANAQFPATQLLPTTACSTNQFSQWNGTAWICAAGTGTSTTSDVTGNLTMLNSTAGAGNILKGGARFIHNYGLSNTFIGEGAGNFTMTGSANTASGRGTLQTNSTGFNNTASGADTLLQNTTGDNNTATGTLALYGNTTGSGNTATGSNALYRNSTGIYNTALGASAGFNLTTGSNNIHIGNEGVAGEDRTIKIGTNAIQTRAFVAGVLGVTPGIAGDALLPVVVAPNGQFGTLAAFPSVGPAGPAGPTGAAGAAGPQGPPGSVDAATNLNLPLSSATAGNIMKGGARFIHNFGTQNTFVGENSGNFTMTGASNTGSGISALASNTTGSGNTASGRSALAFNTTGSSNTAHGDFALVANTTGGSNTASGAGALQSNTTGNSNTATGHSSLGSNTTGIRNTASGENSLLNNTSGNSNTAGGMNALFANTTGSNNTASGLTALQNNTIGADNTASGVGALVSNTAGSYNTATGSNALANTTGDNNTALGFYAGINLTTGNNNIAIANPGVAADAATTRIGSSQTRAFIAGIRGVTPGVADWLPVVIDSNGQLGTGSAAGGGVTSIATGAGLSGGPITSTGTIGLAGTQLLPVSPCALDQIPKWNGTAWVCSAGTAGPSGPVGPAGPVGPQGPAGSIDAATNLTLPISTATQGNIMKGSIPFIHNFGFLNTFIGEGAGNLLMSGGSNTGTGYGALGVNATGANNTASGTSALYSNTSGGGNTAIGRSSLQSNTDGSNNTAIGVSALLRNISGSDNTASGFSALSTNSTGIQNTAIGKWALVSNTTGISNTASGMEALRTNTDGSFNTASGMYALYSNTIGGSNTAFGVDALHSNTSGNENIAIGFAAGNNIITGSANIAIGNPGGASGERATIRIGKTWFGSGSEGMISRTFISGIRGVTTGVVNAIPVVVDSEGQLGTISSSRRFKDNITDMDAASSALMQLRPVTFHNKTDQNPAGRSLQYGLIAEEVAEVYPGLVAYSADGRIETVMYQHLPPMLLNEVQKQQRTIEAQAAELSRQRERISALEQQSARMEMLERELLGIKRRLALD